MYIAYSADEYEEVVFTAETAQEAVDKLDGRLTLGSFYCNLSRGNKTRYNDRWIRISKVEVNSEQN